MYLPILHLHRPPRLPGGGLMASDLIILRMHYNQRRAEAMMQAAAGQLRRARKNDRPAIVARTLKAIMATCVRVGHQTPPGRAPGGPAFAGWGGWYK